MIQDRKALPVHPNTDLPLEHCGLDGAGPLKAKTENLHDRIKASRERIWPLHIQDRVRRLTKPGSGLGADKSASLIVQ